eukprot:tig00000882_g5258.t1
MVQQESPVQWFDRVTQARIAGVIGPGPGHEEVKIYEKHQLTRRRTGIASPKKFDLGIPPHRALFLLRPTHPIRVVCAEILRSPLYGFLNLVVVIIVCASIASRGTGPVWNGLDLAVTIYFTIEVVLKVLKRGLVLHQGSYLRTAWHLLDVVVTVLGWLSYFTGVNNFTSLRALRVLRTLKSLVLLRTVRIFAEAVLSSIPMLLQCIVQLAFFFIIFGIVGTAVFPASLRFRAVDGLTGQVPAGWDPEFPQFICGEAFPPARTPEPGLVCVHAANPTWGYTNFDNTLWVWLLLWQCLSMSRWTTFMYWTWDSLGAGAILFFWAVVIFGSLLVVNLTLAVLNNTYASLVQRDAGLAARARQAGGSSTGPKSADVSGATTRIGQALFRLHTWLYKRYDRAADWIYDRAHSDLEALPAYRYRVEKILEGKTYRFMVDTFTWFGCILICCYYPDMPDGARTAVEAMNVVAVGVYAADAALRVYARGPLRCMVHSMSDCIDVTVAVMGLVQIGINPPDRAAGVRGGSPRLFLYPFRFFRLVRVARYCRFSSMRAITMDTVRSLRTVAGFVPTLLVYILVCALFGMQLFGDTYPLDERPHFASFWDGAILSVFRILTADRWNETMWAAMRYSGSPWAALYFVLLQAIGNFIVLNGLVAVLISSLSSSESRKKAEGELLALKTREALLQGAFQPPPLRSGIRTFASLPGTEAGAGGVGAGGAPRAPPTQRVPRSATGPAPPRRAVGFASPSEPALGAPVRMRAGPGPGAPLNAGGGPAPPYLVDVLLSDSPQAAPPGPSSPIPGPLPTPPASPPSVSAPAPAWAPALGPEPLTLFPVLKLKQPVPPRTVSFSFAGTNGAAAAVPGPLPPRGGVEGALAAGRALAGAPAALDLHEIKLSGAPPGQEEPARPERPAERAAFGPSASESRRTRPSGPVTAAGRPVPAAGAGTGAQKGAAQGRPTPAYRRGSMIRDAWGVPRVTAGFHLPLFEATRGRRTSLPKQPSLLRKAPTQDFTRASSFVPWRAGYSLFVWSPESPARKALRRLIYSWPFHAAVLLVILGSCLTLILDYPSNPRLTGVRVADAVFTCLFLAEAALKILALGFVLDDGAYIRSPWHCLDLAVAIASATSLGSVEGGPGQRAARVLRVFRVLRPLRLIRQIKGIKFVTLSLLRSVPGIVRVTLLLFIVWGFFATLGMQLFMGRLSYCTDRTVATQAECVGTYLSERGGRPLQRAWRPADSNFENLSTAMLTLFEMSTLSNWVVFMYSAMDSTGIGTGPRVNADVAASVYFLAFLVFGVFAVLNWYSAVIVMSFIKTQEERRTRREQEQRVWEPDWTEDGGNPRPPLPQMTTDQKQWAQVLHESLARPLKPRMKRAGQHWRRAIGGFLRRKWFEPVIVTLIAADAAILLANSADQTKAVDEGLMWTSFALSVVFIVEIALRILALGPRQFLRDRWRCLDLLIVGFTAASSAADVAIFYSRPGESNRVTAARGLRVLRIARVFRLFTRTKSLSLLFDTFADCLPGLAELSVFFLLLGFVWAVIGVQAFGTQRRAGNVDVHANFEHVGYAALSLFGFATADRWNDVMWSIAKPAPEDCPEGPGACDAPAAPLYFTTWIWLSRLVFMNLIAAVCIDAFQVNARERLHLVRRRDVERYLRCWQKYDPTASGCIRAHAHLVPLLTDIGPPLGLRHDATRSDILRFVRSLRIPLVYGVHLQYRVLLHALIDRTYMLALVPMVPEIDREARLGYMRECPVLRPYSGPERDTLHTSPTVAEIFAALAVQQQWRRILRARASSRFIVPPVHDVFSAITRPDKPAEGDEGYESDEAETEHVVVTGIRARAEAARALNAPTIAELVAPAPLSPEEEEEERKRKERKKKGSKEGSRRGGGLEENDSSSV